MEWQTGSASTLIAKTVCPKSLDHYGRIDKRKDRSDKEKTLSSCNFASIAGNYLLKSKGIGCPCTEFFTAPLLHQTTTVSIRILLPHPPPPPPTHTHTPPPPSYIFKHHTISNLRCQFIILSTFQMPKSVVV